MINQFPHCDQRILHAPGECEYCDYHPEWQELRTAWGIAFTGHSAVAPELPCPADYARPAGSPADHRQWGGNMPSGVRDQGCDRPPKGWWCSREPGHEGPCAARPNQSFASRVLYGALDQPGQSGPEPRWRRLGPLWLRRRSR